MGLDTINFYIGTWGRSVMTSVLIQPPPTPRALRSSNNNLLMIPCPESICLASAWARASSVLVPAWWNILLDEIWACRSWLSSAWPVKLNCFTKHTLEAANLAFLCPPVSCSLCYCTIFTNMPVVQPHLDKLYSCLSCHPFLLNYIDFEKN